MQITEENERFLTTRPNRFGQLAEKCQKPFHTESYDRPDTSSGLLTRLRYSLLCPPHGKIGRFCTFVFCMLLTWLMAMSISPKDALPGGNAFSLIVLFTTGILAGQLVALVKLPNILGMFLVGVILRNAPQLDIAQHILPFWSSTLRNFTLTVLLLQAGMNLTPIPLRFDSIFYRLHLIPFLAEFTTCSLIYKFLLGLSWSWSFSLGSLLSGVSAAVIVSQLLELQESNYGTNNEIPSQLILVSIVNNAFMIITSHVILAEESIIRTIIQRTLDPFLEIGIGLVFGIALWYFPPQEARFPFFLRSILLLLGSFLPFVVYSAMGQPGNGQLCVLVIGYMAASRWKTESHQCGQTLKQEMLKLINNLWFALRPLYFGLLGCELNLTFIDTNVLGLVFITVFIGLLCRILASLLMTTASSSLNIKERLFLSMALIPKADIQVAFSALVLQKAFEKEVDQSLIKYHYIVLNMTVLASFFTLPLGSIFIPWAGQRLLHQRIVFRRNSSTRHLQTRSRYLTEGKKRSEEECDLEEPLFEEEQADSKL